MTSLTYCVRGALLALMMFALVGAAHSQPASKATTSIPQQGPGDAMDAMRALLNKKKVTYQDLCDLALMQKGEYEKFPTPAARRARLKTLGIYNMTGVSNPETAIATRGALAKVTLNTHNLEKGIMFRLTGWERYAMKDAQALRIMPARYSANQHMSGIELVGVMDSALDEIDKIGIWPRKKNAFKAFGFKSYKDMAAAMQKEQKGKKPAAGDKKSEGGAAPKEPAGAIAVKSGESAQVSGTGSVASPLQISQRSGGGQLPNDATTGPEAISIMQESDVVVGGSTSDLQTIYDNVNEQTQPVSTETPELLKF